MTQELTFFKSAGCPACNGTGYYGRMGIFEVVVFTDGLRDAIIRNAPVQELETIAQKSGFRPLTLDAIEKAKQGYVTLEDIHSILLEKTV